MINIGETVRQIAETVGTTVETVGAENIQNSLLALASGVLASVCARSGEIQKTVNNLYHETLDEKTTDKCVYPFMAGFSVIVASYLTQSLAHGLTSLIPFTACSLWPKQKENPEEHYSTKDEEIKRAQDINKKY